MDYLDMEDYTVNDECLKKYINLRDTLSLKLSRLVALNIISREHAENVYDPILFIIFDMGTDITNSDISCIIINYLIDNPSYYAEYKNNDLYRKIYASILSKILGLPDNVIELEFGISKTEYSDIYSFIIKNHIIAPIEGWENDTCLY
jgi:hypothetical protein